jgi:paraquat-inducible protein B
MTETRDAKLRRTQAEVRRSAWPGWIWAVPIAAFGVAGWLGIRALTHGGETVTVTFDNAYGMKAADTIVTLRGVKIGDVSDVELAPDGQHVDVKLEIDRKQDRYLRSGTRFFLKGAELDISDPSSLKDLLSGPEIAMEPGPGKPARHFTGSTKRPVLTASAGPAIAYDVRFDGAVGKLEDGAPVELRGFAVGAVTSVHLAYDPATGTLSTPVRIAIEPSRLGIGEVARPANGDWRPVVDDMMKRLVGEGLRASLAQDPPLVGPRKVKLEFVSGAPPASLVAGADAPVIPSIAQPDFDSITSKADQVMNKANHVMTKIDALPITETGNDVRRVAARVGALASSPQVADSIAHIDRAVTEIDRTMREVSPQVGPLVAQLRETASAADNAVSAANRTIGGDATSQNDLPAALREMTDMARSVRALADYLDRHPEALVRGRQGSGQ